MSCSTPSMSPRRLSSTATERARGIRRQDVDRADRRHVLAAHQPVALAEELDLLGEQLLQVRLDAVLLQAGVDAELVRASRAAPRGSTR